MRLKLKDVLGTVVGFCDLLPELPSDWDPGTCEAVAKLIRVANQARPRKRVCGHQNEDYPELRCTRRSGHKRFHTNPDKGAKWGMK